MVRWQPWRQWTDLPDVTSSDHIFIKGSLLQICQGSWFTYSANCELSYYAAALSLPLHCTVVCRLQRLHHLAGGALACFVRHLTVHSWPRLEAASPGAYTPHNVEPSAQSPETQVPTATRPFYITDRLEVSSPGPYLSSFEESSAHFTLTQVLLKSPSYMDLLQACPSGAPSDRLGKCLQSLGSLGSL